jgi:predicted nucleic acid-binding protein
MGWLIDTNVLLRLADAESSERAGAEAAIGGLIARGDSVFITTQVVVEFWAVATRPERANGLGWQAETAAEAIEALRDQFPLLDETPEVLDRWLDLVRRCRVSGKHTHDARLAALLLVHGIQQLLTFNTADFPGNWGVQAVHPDRLVAT